MTELRPQARVFSLASDQKSELNALELKIAELTGVAEYLSQKIAGAQGHAERLEKDVEDFRRLKQQAEFELRAQEELCANKRREFHALEMEIKKHEATINSQQDHCRSLAETIEIAEQRSKEAIETIQADTDDKIKAIKHDFETERERLGIELEAHRSQTQADMKLLTEELAQTRKKQQRGLEIEFQDMKRKAEETIAKLLQEGRNKNEALIRATEATALEVHRESESAAKKLLVDANQKAADIIRAAQQEAEEVRRRTHHAEVNFLKERNAGLAELKLMVANAKEEAQSIISAATKEASEIQFKIEQENEARITAANNKISMARKAAEKDNLELMERSKAELAKQAKEQEAVLARKMNEVEERLAGERKKIEDETRSVLASARERAQAIIETANNEKNYKFEEIKALESSMFQSARQSATAITHDAEKIALKIVEEARTRAKTVEKTVEAIMTKATEEAAEIKAKADAYYDKIKRDLPDPAVWDAELVKIRQHEQDRLQALIEPTVMNYLKAIDMAISNIFIGLPSKYQTNKVIQDFAEAIANIQHKKNLIKFGDLIPRLAVSPANPTSHQPIPLKRMS